jgi:hypothetical protein
MKISEQEDMKIDIMLSESDLADAIKMFIKEKRGLVITGGHFSIKYNNAMSQYEAFLSNIILGENLKPVVKSEKIEQAEENKQINVDNNKLNLDVS